MNRTGILDFTSKTFFWMLTLIVLTLVVGSLFGLLHTYQERITRVPLPLRAELIALRFTNLPECFAFADEATGVALHSTIDLDKFTTEQLNQCYTTEKKRGFKDLNFRLVLPNHNKEVFSNNYFHEDDFTLFKEVLVEDEGKLTKEQLIIYVQERIGQ